MNIKMIATDLDDTLLRSNNAMSDYTISVLEKCRAKGIKLVYATARDRRRSISIPLLSELFDGFVCDNGATAYAGSTLIYSKAISTKDLRDLLVAADSAGVKITANCDGIYYANFNVLEKCAWLGLKSYKHADFNTLDVKAENFLVIAETPEESEIAEFTIKKHLPRDLDLLIREKSSLMVILHKETIKSKGLAPLAQHWGIKASEIAAFGDDVIDIDLLEYCGIGVAVSNASDEVKAVADYICESNDNDGVARWLEGHIEL